MFQRVNGRDVNVPTDADGAIDTDVLRQVAGIPDNRALVLQKPDGSNEILNPGTKRAFQPGSYFRDQGLHVRGTSIR